jgi:hypothetical protein
VRSAHCVLLTAFLCLIIVNCRPVYAQWWNPFSPKDYEDCAERAAKDSKSAEALFVLLDLCKSQFLDRRKSGGGYTFYDSRQDRSFDTAGPNPSPEERQFIDHQFSIYMTDKAAAEKRFEEARQRAEKARQDEEAQQAEKARQRAEKARRVEKRQQLIENITKIERDRRTQIAVKLLEITSSNFKCEESSDQNTECMFPEPILTVLNGSAEILST